MPGLVPSLRSRNRRVVSSHRSADLSKLRKKQRAETNGDMRSADWPVSRLAGLKIRFFHWRLGIAAALDIRPTLRSAGPVPKREISLPVARLLASPSRCPKHLQQRPPIPFAALSVLLQGPLFFVAGSGPVAQWLSSLSPFVVFLRLLHLPFWSESGQSSTSPSHGGRSPPVWSSASVSRQTQDASTTVHYC
jgi:hypothetical protein